MGLTDDDKQWFSNMVSDAVSSSEKRLATAIADSDKRGGAELAAVKAELAAVKAELSEVKAELSASIERVETSLLTEFHKWASPLEMRMRSHSATLRTLDLELEAISDRVTKLEPPH